MQVVRAFLHRRRVIVLSVLTFLLSVVFLGIIVNLFSSLLELIFGQTLKGLLTVLLVGIVVTLVLSLLIWALSQETHRWMPLPREMQARPHAGLVALVGPGIKRNFITNPTESPAAAAIRFHLGQGALRHVWLIASDEGVPVAESLRTAYEDQVAFHPVLPPIKNILDIRETFEAARQVANSLEALEMKPEDVIADYTGGTSSMSVGLALAATRHGFAMEFMSKVGASDSVPLQTGL